MAFPYLFAAQSGPIPLSELDANFAALSGTSTGQGIQLIGWPAGSGVNQAATNQFFTQNGAGIQRLNDRVFVGGATVCSGDFPQTTNDWLSAFYNANGYTGYTLGGQLAVLNNNSASAGESLVGAAQSIHFTSASTSTIGGYFVGVNNNATLGTYAWGLYAEGQRVNNTVGAAYAAEFDVRQLGASVVSDPFGQNAGSTIALQLAAGAGVSSTGQFNASAAINVAANPMPFNSGIIFETTSIAGADGTGGSNVGTAVALGPGHQIKWYGAAGVVTGWIMSGTTSPTNATGINFSGVGFQIQQLSNSAPIFYAFPATNAVNYLSVAAAATGVAPILGAGGTDTNIDIRLAPLGTGLVWIGPYTAGSVTVGGYIEVKDSTGTLRKVPCL